VTSKITSLFINVREVCDL